ncbi:MAG: hypothetical protein JO096_06940 [Alphaproteobacteria bacterium]|nr:hypothetical protein [Alphaproteobacteria bacterium]
MADNIEGSSSMSSQQGVSDRNRSASHGGSDRSVVAEFIDAARSTAESLLEEQKQQISDRVRGVAEALEGAARSLHGSQNPMVARYVQQAGDQVRAVSHNLQRRRWNELVAETEEFARRQPTLFVLGAVAVGFITGRLLWTAISVQSRNPDPMRESSRREATREVTAAVSSAPGFGSETTAGHAIGSSGTVESR